MIGSAGTPSASGASAFAIDASNVPVAVSGVLFYGLAGPTQVPFQGGTLCVEPPFAAHDGSELTRRAGV